MESTKNDTLDPTLADEQVANGAGLSSAMHDIRALAARYEEERAQPSAGESLRLAAVTRLQPQHILQPTRKDSSERWKAAVLMGLMVLGLGTSAFALKLFAGPEDSGEAVYLEVTADQNFDEPAWNQPEAPVLPAEDPVLEPVNTSQEIATRPSPVARATRNAAPAPKRIRDRAPASERASSQADTCDEVACLIDPSAACCSAYAQNEAPAAEASLTSAYRPERSEVMRNMRGIQDDVMRCFDAHDEGGIVSVDFVIEPDGSVGSVEVEEGALEFRACIRKEVRSLNFEPLRAPFKMSFPFRK